MKVALGVTGGIACYKAAEVLRRLQDRGHDVTVLMTRSATQFVTPLTFRALSGNRVYVDVFEGAREGHDFEGAFDHIFLAQSTDVLLVAPASANAIARMAAGLADDFLTTFFLALQAPVIIAPAMNSRMWEHPSVRDNLALLRRRGAVIIDPEEGVMACKTSGPGRLAEVSVIVDYVDRLLRSTEDLKGRRFVVTAGPTVEDIDPVRFISNRSSGKMGLALAAAARRRGADVVVIAGPGTPDTAGIVRVRSTGEMRDAVLREAASADVVIKAAAPLDFRPAAAAPQKIKKSASLTLQLEAAPDILKELGAAKGKRILVGFAAETENHLQYGLAKLKAKNLDLIVINPVGSPESGFESDMNEATLVDATGEAETVSRTTKAELAERILDRVTTLLKERG